MVETRSYSLICGSTSLDRDTLISGNCLGQAFDRGEFVDGIEIGMQEAYRDRGRAGLPYAGDGLVERGCIERDQNLAIRFQPLANAEARSRGTSGSGGGERRS